MKKLLVLFLGVFLICVTASASTYAYWKITIENTENIISTSDIGIEVNAANIEGMNGYQISVNNLYPSNIHRVVKRISVNNVGDLNLKYKLNFKYSDKNENEDVHNQFGSTLISFDRGIHWTVMEDAFYIGSILSKHIQCVEVWFRLNPGVDNLNLMNNETFFDIVLTGVQEEDSL